MKRSSLLFQIITAGFLAVSIAGCAAPIKIEPYYENPYQNSPYWYRGNTHTHTKSSDGALYYPAVIDLYTAAGYDFLAITDHNENIFFGGGSGSSNNDPPTLLKSLAATGDIVLLLGSCESGDDWEHHLTALGVERCPEECGSNDLAGGMPYCDGGENQKRINQALEQNGIVILNHPTSVNWAGVEQGWPEEEALQAHGYQGVEISRADLPTWLYLLNHGRMVWGVGSDDFHEGQPGKGGWIVVNSNASPPEAADLLANIRRGNFYAVVHGENGEMDGPHFSKISTLGGSVVVEFRDASTMRFLDCQGLLKQDDFSGEGEVHSSAYLPDADLGYRLPQGYIRIELEDHSGNIAYSQPLHVIGGGACPASH